MSSSNLTKSLSSLIDTEKLSREILLYILYLSGSIVVWLLNKLFWGERTAIRIYDFTRGFETVITYKETFGVFLFKSFIVILSIYSILIVIQALTDKRIGNILYLTLAILVGLASGAGFGGGLVSYLWSNKIEISLAGQIEWLAGALLISAIPAFNKINRNKLKLGMILLLISIIFSSLILEG